MRNASLHPCWVDDELCILLQCEPGRNLCVMSDLDRVFTVISASARAILTGGSAPHLMPRTRELRPQAGLREDGPPQIGGLFKA